MVDYKAKINSDVFGHWVLFVFDSWLVHIHAGIRAKIKAEVSHLDKL